MPVDYILHEMPASPWNHLPIVDCDRVSVAMLAPRTETQGETSPDYEAHIRHVLVQSVQVK